MIETNKITSSIIAPLRHGVIFLLVLAAQLAAQESYRSTYRVAIEKPAQPAQRAGETSTWRFRVLDREGAVRTEILREMPFDIAAPAPAVFEDGTVALIHSFDNVVEFFGTGGGLTKRLFLSAPPRPEYERVIRHAVHDALLVLLISEPGSTSCRLVLFDSQGSILHERTLEGLQATGVAVAPDARTIAAGIRTSGTTGEGEIWLITPDKESSVGGVEEWRSGGVLAKGFPGSFSGGNFSTDGSTFLGRSNVSVTEVDVADGTKRWDYRAPAGRLVVDAVLGTNGATVLTADAPTLENGAWIYRKPVTRVVTSDGRVVSERAVPSVGFKRASLVVKAGITQVEFDGVVY